MKPYRTRSMVVGVVLGMIVALVIRSARGETEHSTATASISSSSSR
ncbi:MAG: hypothetical protein H0T46_20590 [Deltaproteobacteria bacterium]|nr:hypothetical protein [Deltaproteobacteria bacterium]